MSQVRVLQMNDDSALQSFARTFAVEHPTYRFERWTVDGNDVLLTSDQGGIKVYWLYAGQGDVFLPAGFRTKEGDGNRLPSTYEPEPIAPALADALAVLRETQDALVEPASTPVQAILSRWQGDSFVGDFAGDLWKLEHIPVPWARDERTVAALHTLFDLCPCAGYSRKTVDSWEPLMEGDQLIVAGGDALRVRGNFTCLTLEKTDRTASHVPAAMRLRYLKDTSGGCNFDFDPFRRLPLTWYMSAPGRHEDAINFANSHVVNIAKETSPAHFHPPPGAGKGAAQNEFYLVLDPGAYGLHTYGRRASLVAYPDLHDLSRYEEYRLEPGHFVHIPPGTGHRGIDVFVNVITIPGFKPHNEFYIDRDIMETGKGAPYNPDLLHFKNYEDIRLLAPV